MVGLTTVALADLMSGAEAAADLTVPILVTNHNHYDLIVIPRATDQILTRLPVGHQPHMAVISPAGKVYTTGPGTDTASGVNTAALLHSLWCADNQDAGEVAVIDNTRDTDIL
jgi:DNA-binding beta-propeller fold protein YncE